MQGGVNRNIVYPNLSYRIVGILFEISNELGGRFKELHYQRATVAAFKKYNIKYISQCPYLIKFNNEIIGRYYMDFVVEDKLVLEIKRGDYFSLQNINQLFKHLQATNLKLGLLANFTTQGLRYKRIVNII